MPSAMTRKVVYIAGPITEVPGYYKPFEQAMDEIQTAGMIPLSPCWMPVDLPREKRIRIGLAMLAQADGALFLPGWERSADCKLEMDFCGNTGKPTVSFNSLQNLWLAARRMKEAVENA